ncbi:DUF268 domain-containing protein [Marinobacterium sedimentorum]|uniref:DUF268 domain-containing protein n=1 Tax=Marinobacterium sedimentorum TaxID=2927804 RepID=UPI0020C69352|nr:DUF268 domain-containing protein [Marinobacterium sedimentorum]MCP8689372.1 DUF268 domain-containing protein [Marinobacterium sedimentorum]
MQIYKTKKLIRAAYLFLVGAGSFFKFKPIGFIRRYVWFFGQFNKFRNMGCNTNFKEVEFYPCLSDNLSYTPIEPTYFFQDTWAAKHIFDLKPEHHYDIGSSAKTIGIISQFTPVTMIDIRPIGLELENLFFEEGSILDLPFESGSIKSLSSLCVVEHIGLGRYGDDIDPFGSENAIKELKRVLCVGGVLLISVPVDNVNKIYFNAHRAFTRNYILELFNGFDLLEEKYHYGTSLFDSYDPSKGFGTGLYMFKKVSNVY